MENRFTASFWDPELHKKLVEEEIEDSNLKPIIDEESGGIMAYAIGEEHRQTLLKNLNGDNE